MLLRAANSNAPLPVAARTRNDEARRNELPVSFRPMQPAAAAHARVEALGARLHRAAAQREQRADEPPDRRADQPRPARLDHAATPPRAIADAPLKMGRGVGGKVLVEAGEPWSTPPRSAWADVEPLGTLFEDRYSARPGRQYLTPSPMVLPSTPLTAASQVRTRLFEVGGRTWEHSSNAEPMRMSPNSTSGHVAPFCITKTEGGLTRGGDIVLKTKQNFHDVQHQIEK